MAETVRYPGDDFVSRMTHSQIKAVLKQNRELIDKIQALESLIQKKDEALRDAAKLIEQHPHAMTSDPLGLEIREGWRNIKQALSLTPENVSSRMEKMEKVVEAARQAVRGNFDGEELAHYSSWRIDELEQALAELDESEK